MSEKEDEPPVTWGDIEDMSPAEREAALGPLNLEPVNLKIPDSVKRLQSSANKMMESASRTAAQMQFRLRKLPEAQSILDTKFTPPRNPTIDTNEILVTQAKARSKTSSWFLGIAILALFVAFGSYLVGILTAAGWS